MPQTLPRLHGSLRHLTLRQRILLLFAGLGAAAVLALTLALYLAYLKHKSPWSLDALVTAGVLSGCAIVSLILGLWRLFDQNVAKPLERMAGELRSRAHAHVAVDLTDLNGRHLGDLAPAATDLMRHLNQARNELAETVARETSREALEKEKLLSLLADLPMGVVVCTAGHRLALYNQHARTLLRASNTPCDIQEVDQSASIHPALCLGRPIADYLEEDTVLKAYQGLREGPRNAASSTFACPTRGRSTECQATMRLLDHSLFSRGGRHPAYVLFLHGPALSSEQSSGMVPHSHGLVYDFDLLDHPGHAGPSDLPLHAQTYVVFDTETTGLLPDRGDEIVQIAAIRIVNGRRIPGEVFNTLVNPGRSIPPASTRIHGITDGMVADAPTVEQAIAQFHAFAQGAVLVAHNANFDMAFLRRVEARIGLRFDQTVLDTAVLSAMVFGAAENHSLDALAARLGVELSSQARHTALGDATATAEILLKLLPALQARELPNP